MSTLATNLPPHTPAASETKVEKVISTLKWTFGAVPIVAGADKFADILVDWHKYLSPFVPKITYLPAHIFMNIVGVIEITAGMLVLLKPKAGSLVVSLWLLGIAVNLVMTGQYYDVAVRDAVMSICAFCLFTLLR